MVSLYTADALQVNATGAHKVTTAFFDEFWKIGDIKHHATFEQVAVLNPTTATATGTWQWTGKAANGSPIDTGGYWTGVYVKDGDSWKIKMITAGVKAPPPALKADELKAEVEQILANYSVCYTKQDAACIAANYTSDGFFVNPAGVHKPVDAYGNLFKVGFNKLDTTLTQIQPVGSNAAIATGTWHITGKDKDGKDLDASGAWGATYKKEGGKLKIQMLTASPKPPPAK